MADTICAISTPYGTGGIAIVRVSGEQAITICERLLCSSVPLHQRKAGTVHHAFVRRTQNGQEEVLDEVMVSVFRSPHSFTGEDIVEIACHGSLYIQQELLRWLIDAGCRLAQAGEFSQRAFLHGKMDLTRAEAIADLIAAESKAEKDLALSQLRGSIPSVIQQMRENLLHLTSLLELELDFADHEELEFADRTELLQLCRDTTSQLRQMIQSFQTGNAIRHGVPVAIVGATNAGKSTLLNALLGEERAIVSDIQGTTRDTVEDRLTIDGIMFRLIDTAGLRATNDPLESQGIQRSKQVAQQAQILLHVIDIQNPQDLAMEELQQKPHIIHIYNKCDTCPATPHPSQPDTLFISAKRGDVEEVKNAMVEIVRKDRAHSQGAIISNARHYEAFVRAEQALQRVEEGLRQQLSGELIAMDLHDCLDALGEITGQVTSQEVLNTIFSKFCIGK